MNNQWVKILVFGLLFGIAGYFIGRCCGHGCRAGGGCHQEMSCCKDGGHGCAHGDAKGGCEHGQKSCCAGEGHGHGEGHRDMDHENAVHAVVHGLKERNFQGDTTITIEGGTVHVTRTGDKMEVKVDMSDSLKVVEKTVEAH